MVIKLKKKKKWKNNEIKKKKHIRIRLALKQNCLPIYSVMVIIH